MTWPNCPSRKSKWRAKNQAVQGRSRCSVYSVDVDPCGSLDTPNTSTPSACKWIGIEATSASGVSLWHALWHSWLLFQRGHLGNPHIGWFQWPAHRPWRSPEMPPLVPLSLSVQGWTMARMAQPGERLGVAAKTSLTHWKGRCVIPVPFSMCFSRIRSIWSLPSIHCVGCDELCTKRWMLRLSRKIGKIGLALDYLDFSTSLLSQYLTTEFRSKLKFDSWRKVKEVWTVRLCGCMTQPREWDLSAFPLSFWSHRPME